MALIQINDLTFGYDGSPDLVFEHLSLSLDTRWKLGLIGRNGRGKTTLLHLLQGAYEYRGSIQSPVAFDYFPFPVPDPDRTGLEVAEALFPNLEEWRLHRELGLLDLDSGLLYRPYSTLSGGEQTKLLLALLFLHEGHFLLIDEPTNHLDRAGRVAVSRYLGSKQGFLLISHDRMFLDGCVDHILSLGKEKVEVQRGTYSSWEENRRRQDQFEAQQNERLERDVARLAAAAERTSGWSDAVEKTKYGSLNSGLKVDRGYIGHKSAKMMKRAKTVEARRQTALEEKQMLLREVERNDSLLLTPLVHPKQLLIEVQDLIIQYGEKPLFAPLSFQVRPGERVAVTGPNGCGKSSLISLLMGQEIPHSGLVRLASGLVLSYVSQQTGHLQGCPTDYAGQLEIDRSRFLTILRKFGFPRELFERPLEQYSEGQKKKVLLAGSLCQSAHLYLWDEPLNFVDLLSRLQLEELLKESNATLLLVEHDAAFVDAVSTRTVMLAPAE